MHEICIRWKISKRIGKEERKNESEYQYWWVTNGSAFSQNKWRQTHSTRSESNFFRTAAIDWAIRWRPTLCNLIKNQQKILVIQNLHSPSNLHFLGLEGHVQIRYANPRVCAVMVSLMHYYTVIYSLTRHNSLTRPKNSFLVIRSTLSCGHENVKNMQLQMLQTFLDLQT